MAEHFRTYIALPETQAQFPEPTSEGSQLPGTAAPGGPNIHLPRPLQVSALTSTYPNTHTRH